MDSELIQKFNYANILVVGDFILDQYVMGDVERISPEAPIPVVRTTHVKDQLGGAGNVVNNIQCMKGHARILTSCGIDPAGDLMVKLLLETGADTKYILRDPSINTIRKIRVTARTQQIVRVDFEEPIPPTISNFIEFVKNNIDDLLYGMEVIVVSDYGKGAITPELMSILVNHASFKKVPILVDPKGKDWSKYQGVTACTPNLSEFSDVVGKKIGQTMEDRLHKEAINICKKYSLEYLLITRSECGMSLVCKNGNKIDFPVKKKEVIDVSGAGDTVISALALSIASKIDIESGCKIANMAASIAVSKFGTSPVKFDELFNILSEKNNSGVCTFIEIQDISASLHLANKKIVFTNGCFDLVHAGHIHSLEFAKSQGDVLIVGINSDQSIKRLKGEKRPIINELDRATLLKSMKMVDYVVIFDEDTPYELINIIQPDILVKGEDYLGKAVIGQDIVEKRGGQVKLVDLKPGLSTSQIIENILKVYLE